jgi:ubiquinone/menaquinone biosynthesis C-methylase UbiE
MTDYLTPGSILEDPRLASVLDELSFWSARFGALLFTHLELVRGITGLDLGCGTGFPLFELAEVHGPSCRFVGADLWGEALARARLKRATFGHPNVVLARADGGALPFAGGQFDLVVSNLGINNFTDREAVLAECARVARPGARLVLTTNVRGHLRELYAAYRATLVELGKGEYLERLEMQEAHRADTATLARLVEAAGFRVTRAIEERFEMRYLDAGALFRHRLTRVGFLEGWRSVVKAGDEREVFAALERRLDAAAAHGGEVRMTVPMLYLEARLTSPR